MIKQIFIEYGVVGIGVILNILPNSMFKFNLS